MVLEKIQLMYFLIATDYPCYHELNWLCRFAMLLHFGEIGEKGDAKTDEKHVLLKYTKNKNRCKS